VGSIGTLTPKNLETFAALGFGLAQQGGGRVKNLEWGSYSTFIEVLSSRGSLTDATQTDDLLEIEKGYHWEKCSPK